MLFGGDITDFGADDELVAVKQMMEFLVKKQGLDADDASMLLDMAGNLIICQIVNPMKTVRMELSKELLERMRGI